MKILWLHHRKGWAIHNIGKTWVGHLNADFRLYTEVQPEELSKYDYVFHFMRSWKLFHRRKNEILVLHDPIEILDGKNNVKPEIQNVIESKQCLVESEELKQLVFQYTGKKVIAVGTMSHLSSQQPIKVPCKFMTLGSPMIRKNPKLRESLIKYAQENNYIFNSIIGFNVINDFAYSQIFRNYPVYICTSHREGGPLPPMDSMSQGGVVISTPVGQMTELIEDGTNGFLCSKEEDFKNRMTLLYNNPELLYKMRMSSYIQYKDKRSLNHIRNIINEVLCQ